ncbi:MAG: MFS transporter [Parafannyhessea sp.]|uniref:MFS transporter n=1 Tax=Parafannyhessea sp. TaxID=2847324 RepID=UPI003EFC4A94
MTALLLVVIYLSFVSLGLPDGLLGSAWPTMHASLGAAVSAAGTVSLVICLGTIVSSLLTDRLVKRLGAGGLTACSVGLTAVALFGFSASTSFWQLVLWAVPYGLGAGAVDAALNAYVATHFAPRHMNWLHSCWGIGAAVGPMVMSWQMATPAGWQGGYRIVGFIQVALVAAIFASLPLWHERRDTRADAHGHSGGEGRASKLELTRRPGVVQAMLGFLCYCSIESTCGLWSSTFLVMGHGVSTEAAALLVSLFYGGITVGRLISGVLTLRLDGRQLLRAGEATMALGILVLLLGRSTVVLGAGLTLLGLGCAPIYPQMIQLTPSRFGSQSAQSLMGLQMACAYVGSMAAPPVMGAIIEHVSPLLMPVAEAALLVLMAALIGSCDRRVEASRPSRAA